MRDRGLCTIGPSPARRRCDLARVDRFFAMSPVRLMAVDVFNSVGIGALRVAVPRLAQ